MRCGSIRGRASQSPSSHQYSDSPPHANATPSGRCAAGLHPRRRTRPARSRLLRRAAGCDRDEEWTVDQRAKVAVGRPTVRTERSSGEPQSVRRRRARGPGGRLLDVEGPRRLGSRAARPEGERVEADVPDEMSQDRQRAPRIALAGLGLVEEQDARTRRRAGGRGRWRRGAYDTPARLRCRRRLTTPGTPAGGAPDEQV